MAGTYTEFYVVTTGSNLNSGSTTGNTATYTGVGDSDGTSVFTPSDGSTPASSVNVGDFASVYVTAGATVATFIGRVTNVAAGVNGAITVSTTAKSGTFPAASAGAHTITCKVGGAWAGPSGATSFPFGFVTAAQTDAAGDVVRVNFKNGTTYSITAAMSHNVAGPIWFQGYTTSAGDGGRAIIDGGTTGASYVLLTMNATGTQVHLRDLIFQNNGATGSAVGVSHTGARSIIERVTVNSVRGNGLTAAGAGSLLIEVEAYACGQANASNTAGISAAQVVTLDNCTAHHNTGTNVSGVISSGTLVTLNNCILAANGKDGVVSLTVNICLELDQVTCYGNTGAGVNVTGNNADLLVSNSLLANNGTYGVSSTGTGAQARLVNSAFWSNTTAATNGAIDDSGTVTCSAAPMTDPANGDFSLNTTAGGGAACRGAGRGKFPLDPSQYTKTTTGFPDIGAVQSQAGAASVGGDDGGYINIVINQW